MDTFRPTSVAAVCFCLCVASAVAQAPSAPADGTGAPAASPMPLTTDTVEYCGRLAAELDSQPDAPKQVRDLTVQGRRMCDEGHVIGGLMRLRHAMMILREMAARH